MVPERMVVLSRVDRSSIIDLVHEGHLLSPFTETIFTMEVDDRQYRFTSVAAVFAALNVDVPECVENRSVLMRRTGQKFLLEYRVDECLSDRDQITQKMEIYQVKLISN